MKPWAILSFRVWFHKKIQNKILPVQLMLVREEVAELSINENHNANDFNIILYSLFDQKTIFIKSIVVNFWLS